MASDCNHPVGYIQCAEVSAQDWNTELAKFMAVVDDFNVRGQRDQISHPGYVAEFTYCPVCGERLDRSALGLQTFFDASVLYKANKSVANQAL